MNRRLRCIALLAALASGQAGAVTLCRLMSSGVMPFGNYDILSPAPTDTLMNVTVRCERNGGLARTLVSMQLGEGLHGGSIATRRMLRLGLPLDTLAYNLFRDSGRSSIWGYSDGVNTVTQAVDIADGRAATLTFTIFGRIPPMQDVRVGLYWDSLQVTISP